MGKTKNVIVLDKPRVIDVEQQLLVSERDDLLESEAAYKRRIEQMEEEAADMLRSFDIMYNENRLLRSKLDLPDGTGADKVESYNSVFKERQHFREANRAFKRRIKQLEDDADDSKKSYEELDIKYKLLTQKAQLQTEYATKAKDEKIGELVGEQDELNEKVSMFIKEREQYEEHIKKLVQKENELQNKCDSLETDRHELELRCEVLQSDRETLKEKVTDLEVRIPDPELKAKEEQQYLGLQAQVATLQVANKDSTYEIHRLKEEIRILNKTHKEKAETVDKALSALDIFEDKKKQENSIEKIDKLEEDLSVSKNTAVVMLKENDKLKSENAIVQSEIANLKLEIKQLEDDGKNKQATIDEMSVAVKGGHSLNDDYQRMQSKLLDVVATKQALENELIQEKKLNKLKVAELNNDVAKTAEALKQKENALSRSEQDAKKLQYENDSLQKVVDAQAIELRNMKAQLEQMQNLLDERTNKYEDMKKSEKEALDEMKTGRLELHTVKRELDDLKNEKRGTFGILRKEMELAKEQRTDESDRLRKETLRLREEVKNLKESEHKISIMESEINRLLLRLKRTEKFRKIPTLTKTGNPSSKQEGTITVDREEMTQLRKKSRELEKEKHVLLQEKRQWEILREKYVELQQTAKRLNNENKRVRGNLDGTESKVELLEKRFKQLNGNTDSLPVQNAVQMATYVDKNPLKQALVKKMPKLPAKDQNPVLNKTPVETKQTNTKPRHNLKTGKKSDRKIADANPRTKHKRATLPAVQSSNGGLKAGKGYRELHGDRYKTTSFKLGLL